MNPILYFTLTFILSVKLIIGNLGSAFLAWVNIMGGLGQKKKDVVIVLDLLCSGSLGISVIWTLIASLLVLATYPALITRKSKRIMKKY